MIWAFSFGIISHYLRGFDAYLLALTRCFLAFLIFSPFIRANSVATALKLRFIFIGALQIGIMYLFFFASFKYLKGYEVALFSVFTPIYITIFDAILKRQIELNAVLAAVICILGAVIVRYGELNDGFFIGFCYIQAANICFALAQIWLKNSLENGEKVDFKELFSYFYLGAFIVTFFAFIIFGEFRIDLNIISVSAVLYLGFIASGLGYFWWGKGVAKSSASQIAVMNNAPVPLAIFADLFIWQTPINGVLQLIAGSALIIIAILIAKIR